MGYTHYWRRRAVLPEGPFVAFVADVMRLRDEVERAGILIAGPLGDGEPILNEVEVSFNGKEACGHPQRNLGITWPAEDAQGVALNGPLAELAGSAGTWLAGAALSSRTCGGDCAHETFVLEREFDVVFVTDADGAKTVYREAGTRETHMWFSCCKTAYKPYDLFVTAVLIAAKHHFGDLLTVSSDGEESNWEDGRRLCAEVLEYGHDFRLPEPVA
jgi:hypothetical protein